MPEQKYALLYCNYDSEKGNRNWKQLLNDDRDILIEIDLEVALAALADGRNDAGTPLGRLAKKSPHEELS